MSAQINEENIEKDDINIIYFYQDKEISMFMNNIIKINIQRIFSDLNNLIDKGDWKRCILLINKLIIKDIYKYLNEDYKIKFLDILIKQLLPNIYLYLESNVNDIFEFIYKILKQVKNYKLDWKLFYTLFYVLQLGDSMTKTDSRLFFNIIKSYSEDSVTLNEYKIMVRSFFDDILYPRQLNYCFSNFTYFFPKKYLVEDDELQLRLFYFMQNNKTKFYNCCTLFEKILQKEGKLFFSKDIKKNKEYIESFIKYYFTYLEINIKDQDSFVSYNYVPIIDKEDENIYFQMSIISILMELLFNQNFKDIYHLIDTHLNIILNKSLSLLKEDAEDELTGKYINFLRAFLYKLNRYFRYKQYDNKIGKYILIYKTYEDNKELYDRLLIILKYLSLNLEQLFLFSNKGCYVSFKNIFIFLSSVKLDDEYMKQVLQNLNFDNYIKILQFLKENSETKMDKYVKKLQIIIPLLLNEYVFLNYPKIKYLTKDAVEMLADQVNSSNSYVATKILILFYEDLFKIKDLNKKNKIYDCLVPIITEATKKIMKNLIMILDIIANTNFNHFYIFVLEMKKFLGEESKDISVLYSNFIENNEIENSNLQNYFLMINEEEHITMFNHMYNNLLYINDSNKIEINKTYIYPKFDKDFNIDISKCSIEIYGEKQLKRYQKIFSFYNYSKIFINNKMVKHFYEIYFALMNQRDKKFKKFGLKFFGFVINSLLECKFNEKNNLIEYPSEYHINISTQIYEKIIVPYEQIILDYITRTEIDKDNRIYEKQVLEEIFENYIYLIYQVNKVKCNIILNLNFEEENINGYQYIQHQMILYKKYKAYLKNSFKLITQIYKYNEGKSEKKLFNNDETNLYFEKILRLKIEENNKKIKEKKAIIENIDQNILKYYFDLNFYLSNKIRLSIFRDYKIIKTITPKEDSYYTCLELFSLNINSVNHPSRIIFSPLNEIYSINPERIKNIYNNIYNNYITVLEKIGNNSLNEQNIMKNIGISFKEFSLFYISLFPYDSLDVLEKIGKISMLLKLKQFKKIEIFIYEIINDIKNILQEIPNLDIDKRYMKYCKKNEIIEKEINKIFGLLQENKTRNSFIERNLKNIEMFIEKSLNIIYKTEIENDIKYNNISHQEIYLLYDKLVDYAIPSINKKSELYRKMLEFAFDKLIIHKSPVSIRLLWLKHIYDLIKGEYNSYVECNWIIFKSDEEYMKYREELKNIDSEAKYYVPYPQLRILEKKFKYDDYLNSNLKYNLNIKELLTSVAEIDEFVEDSNRIDKIEMEKLYSIGEILADKVEELLEEKSLVDSDNAKMFYFMFKLKYLDINNEDISEINFSTEYFSKFEEKIDYVCVTYEFLLGKYQYMLENKLFGIKEKNEFWKIIDGFTNGVDKAEDNKIHCFFDYLIENSTIRDLEFIFDIDFFNYPIKFVSSIYHLFMINFQKKITDIKILKQEKTEELIAKIFSSEENIINQKKYLKSIF